MKLRDRGGRVPADVLARADLPRGEKVLAHTVANDEPHELNRPYGMERFETGALIDEHGAAAVAH